MIIFFFAYKLNNICKKEKVCCDEGNETLNRGSNFELQKKEMNMKICIINRKTLINSFIYNLLSLQ